MFDSETNIEILELKIAKLELKDGDKLAMICPDTWVPRQIATFQAYMDTMIKNKDWKFECLLFPGGTELAVISKQKPETDRRFVGSFDGSF